MNRALIAILLILLAACAQPAARPSVSPDAELTEPPPASASPTAQGYVHILAATPNPELREELLAMKVQDQAVRTGVAPPGDDRTAEELFAAWDQVDADNQARMEEILDEFGWPGWSLVGRDGAEAAWVIIQHADLNLDLQRRGLAMLTAAVEADDASKGDLAYLMDRVRVADREPQVYGTQWQTGPDGEPEPRTPIEDEANVDARRAEAGLSTLAEYLEDLEAFFEPTPSPGGP